MATRGGEQFEDHLQLHFSADVDISLKETPEWDIDQPLWPGKLRSIRDYSKSSVRFSNIRAAWSEVRCQLSGQPDWGKRPIFMYTQ